MHAMQIIIMQTFLLHTMFVLHTLCKSSPQSHRKDFAYAMQNFSPTIQEGFCIRYAKLLPYHIGRILCTLRKISPLQYRKNFVYPTQNCSLCILPLQMSIGIQHRSMLISVLQISALAHVKESAIMISQNVFIKGSVIQCYFSIQGTLKEVLSQQYTKTIKNIRTVGIYTYYSLLTFT